MSTPYTVSSLTTLIKNLLEPPLMRVRVKGEVTNLRLQASGHLYFTLKDAQAQLSAVLFRSSAAGQEVKQGDEIVVEGSITLYAPRGNYQIIVQKVEKVGLGDLLLQFQQLKEKLAQQGLFAPERKKPLPPYPKKIGVITSPSGAVIQDILHVLSRRAKGFHVIVSPVRVQGKGAEAEIASAIDELNLHQLVDVIIVARGGGSLEDLWPFNEECVARAVFRSSIPIISAVGHETDFSICDFVADFRAPTPSAAAEIVMKEKGAQTAFLEGAHLHLSRSMRKTLEYHAMRLDEWTLRLDRQTEQNLMEKRLNLSRIKEKLAKVEPQKQVQQAQKQLGYLLEKLQTALRHQLQVRRERLSHLAIHLGAIDPKNVLKKGYCIPFAENRGSVILSGKQLSPGQNLELLFHDAQILVKTL